MKLKYYCDDYKDSNGLLRPHLICKPYSINNLHRMAKELDIKRCWFHKDHYDIPKKRVLEVMEKCIVVSPKQIVIIKNGHTQEMAGRLQYIVYRVISKDSKIIGKLGRGNENTISYHDIDLLLPGMKVNKKLIDDLSKILKPRDYELTDWGGVFFHDTKFGDVDVFFNTKDFTY
jgi:hypothetical protein